MAKTVTCHDAILVFRRESFLAELINYEITVKVYPAPTPEIPGRYYVIIQEEEQFRDSAWEINIHKRTVIKAVLDKVIKEIQESERPENVTMIEYKRTLKESGTKEGLII